MQSLTVAEQQEENQGVLRGRDKGGILKGSREGLFRRKGEKGK